MIDNEELARNFKEENIDFIVVDARSDAEVGVAAAELLQRKADFVFLSSNLVVANIDKVVPLLNAHNIPTYGPSESLIMRENGALTGIASSFYEVGKELAFRGKIDPGRQEGLRGLILSNAVGWTADPGEQEYC